MEAAAEKICQQAPERGAVARDAESGADRDPLSTCPEHLRARYRRAAEASRRGSRVAAIKLKCLDCVCWNSAEVRRCEIRDCALWPFRPYQWK